MNGLGIAHRLARAAISAVIANAERSVIFLRDSPDGTCIHALPILRALFLIDLVHFFSFATEGGRLSEG